MLKKGFPILIILAVLFYSSCKRELAIPSWEAEVVAPLISSSLKIGDLLTDSLIEKNSNGSFVIVYQQDLFSLTIDSMLEMQDSATKYTARLDSLDLGIISVTNSLSIGEMANNLSSEEQAIIQLLTIFSLPTDQTFEGVSTSLRAQS